MIFEITIIFPPIKHFKKNCKKIHRYNSLFFNHFQKTKHSSERTINTKKNYEVIDKKLSKNLVIFNNNQAKASNYYYGKM